MILFLHTLMNKSQCEIDHRASYSARPNSIITLCKLPAVYTDTINYLLVSRLIVNCMAKC